VLFSLPTFVIGLREGLEAALIVSIVATFLRRNGASLRGMWAGVGAGVALSIAVGIVLKVIEQGLPQSQQEGMETVIGAIAVFFVTGMILWMRTHARTMKKELEQAAASALREGTTTALAIMAFLAVLREGFETSVFLLATIQGASSGLGALVGAIIGILVAVGLGIGIYAGGVRLNLHRFFNITGIFLILVAAGLVMNAFRTAHEAGWVSVGQGRTVSLPWVQAGGGDDVWPVRIARSVFSAISGGVFGLNADPRVIEVLAWFGYLVPMLVIAYCPARFRPGPALAQRLRVLGAGAAVVAAVALFAFVPQPSVDVPRQAPLAGGGTAAISVKGDAATLTARGQTFSLTRSGTTSDEGADTSWTATRAAGRLPARLGLDQLLTYTGQRIPVGLSVATAPGPYAASWADHTGLRVLTRDGGLVDAVSSGDLVLTISGGGLDSPRTFTVNSPAWRVDQAYVANLSGRLATADTAAQDRMLWKHWLPVVLLVLAALLLISARRHRLSAARANDHDPARTEATQVPEPEGTTHADSLA